LGIVISESAAKKLSANSVNKVDITINNNDILINLFGDNNNNNYKCFPDIGETCEKRALCSRRRINQNSLLYDFNSSNSKKINHDTDTIFYIPKGSIIYDIEVFCNCEIENISNKKYYEQILKYREMNIAFYKEVVETLKPFIEDREKYHPSSDVEYYYKRYSDLINPITLFKYDDNTFDNMVVRIRTYNKNKLSIGSKITGRYGSKGVISAILPDEEMPMNEYGEYADVCLNPMGVPSRLNLGQLYEMELNFMGDQVLRSIKDKPIEEQYKTILKFYKIVNENQYNFIKENTKTKKSVKEFIDDCYKHGLMIHQPPFFGNIKMEDMIELYKTFGYNPYHCTYKGNKIKTPLIFGNIYYIRLKHDPSSKMSARSSGELSLNNTPSKSMSYRDHVSLFRQTPVRAGRLQIACYKPF